MSVHGPNLKNELIFRGLVTFDFLFLLSFLSLSASVHTIIMQHWMFSVLFLCFVFCDVSTQRKKKTVQTLSRGINELHIHKQNQISQMYSYTMENRS